MPEQANDRAQLILGTAIVLTGLAEVFYLIVWGFILFPGGSLAGKAVWAATCGIAMGSAIGAATLVLVEGRTSGLAAIAAAAAIMVAIGSFCAWLCSRIDAKFDYFGGPENGTLLILSGVIPAIIGGLLYGWWLYGNGNGVDHAY